MVSWLQQLGHFVWAISHGFGGLVERALDIVHWSQQDYCNLTSRKYPLLALSTIADIFLGFQEASKRESPADEEGGAEGEEGNWKKRKLDNGEAGAEGEEYQNGEGIGGMFNNYVMLTLVILAIIRL